MKHLIKENNLIYFTDNVAEVIKKIPTGVYSLKKDEWRGFYLVTQPNFELPKKLYGELTKYADRYIYKFEESVNGLGIHLSGYKGTGKTLLTKYISTRLKMPTILISEVYQGTDFNNLMTTIAQEALFIFDEFDKVYNTEEKQNELLTILDGAFSTKKMFILTSNTNTLSPYLTNRPGRIHYHKVFSGLESATVEEVVSELLNDKDKATELIEITKALGHISMDSLISIIEEMNMFKCDVREAIRFMNINVENCVYSVVIFIKGKRYTTSIFGHPLASPEFNLYYKEDKEWMSASYTVKLKQMQISYGEDGQIEMEHTDGTKLIFNKQVKEKFEI